MVTEAVPERDVYDESTRESGLEENVAGAVAYVLGFVTGIIMFVVDDRPAVRFHAAQSIVLSGAFVGFNLLMSVLSTILFASLFSGTFFVTGLLWIGFSLIWAVVGFVGLALWIYMIYTAYTGRRVVLPLVGSIAENLAGN